MDEADIQRALDVVAGWAALGNETFEAAGARFVRNAACPAIRDANHVDHVTARTHEEIAALLDRVEREYAGFPHRRIDLNYRASPLLEPALSLAGYEHHGRGLVLLLEGELRGEPRPFEIRAIATEADWDTYAALRLADWLEARERLGQPAAPDVGQQMIAATRMKTPPVRVFLGCIDGEPQGYFSSWEGSEGVGQVEDLFVQPGYRHRGLATALIHHCVRDVRAHGAGPVVITADPTDSPKQMYAAMGWQPVAMEHGYWRDARNG